MPTDTCTPGDKIRRLKMMVRNLGKLFQTADGDDFTRVSGLAVCPKCGLEYFEHPQIGNDVLHIDCDGNLLKL